MTAFDDALAKLRDAYNRGREGIPLPHPATGHGERPQPTVYTRHQRCAWWKGYWDYQRFGAIE